MVECVFCKIISGVLTASFVYRDDLCCAFMDIRPVNPGHVLVVPIEHRDRLSGLNPETGSHMFVVAQRLAGALYSVTAAGGGSLVCQGVNLVLSDGSVAGQEIWHAHLHVIPRFVGDGFGFSFGPGYTRRAPPQRDQLDRTAGEIRAVLGAVEAR